MASLATAASQSLRSSLDSDEAAADADTAAAEAPLPVLLAPSMSGLEAWSRESAVSSTAGGAPASAEPRSSTDGERAEEAMPMMMRFFFAFARFLLSLSFSRSLRRGVLPGCRGACFVSSWKGRRDAGLGERDEKEEERESNFGCDLRSPTLIFSLRSSTPP